MTSHDYLTECLSKLCWKINDNKYPGAPNFLAYRAGNQVSVTEMNFTPIGRYSAEEFRTFAMYRGLWGYAGKPAELLNALQSPSEYFYDTEYSSEVFDAGTAQDDPVLFTLSLISHA